MKDIFIFLFGAVAGKLIEDNLPNLHYKNLLAGFQKYGMPVLLLATLGFYSVLSNITKDKEVQKTYLILLVILVATIALDKLGSKQKAISG